MTFFRLAQDHEGLWNQLDKRITALIFRQIIISVIFLHIFTLTCAKISILVQYLRIFPKGSRTVQARWIGIAVIIINAAIQTFMNIFHCKSIYAFWNMQYLMEHPGACESFAIQAYHGNIGNLFTSVMIFIILQPTIWKLKLGHMAKISLGIHLCIRSHVSGSLIVTLPKLTCL